MRRHLWLLLFGLAASAGLATGFVRPAGLVWLAALAAVSFAFSRPGVLGWRRVVLAAAIVALAAGLMTHQLPGFANPRVISAWRLSPDAVPYSLHLNFDKTVLGLFLVGCCHPRIARAKDWRAMLAATAPVAAGTIVLLMALSLAGGYVRFDPKIPAITGLWLAANLLSTCLAEEAVFRGFVQAELARAWRHLPRGEWLALLAAAVLFGVAHAAGGILYVTLATLAGIGYGWAYQRTRRIEAAILTHFALNALHFFLFTYPALGPAR